jgi:hypothetical protein
VDGSKKKSPTQLTAIKRGFKNHEVEISASLFKADSTDSTCNVANLRGINILKITPNKVTPN